MFAYWASAALWQERAIGAFSDSALRERTASMKFATCGVSIIGLVKSDLDGPGINRFPACRFFGLPMYVR